MKNLVMITTYISNSYLSFIVSGLFTFSFVLFYLDDWKFSSNNLIKLLQIISFILSLILIIIFAYCNTVLEDIINYAKDNNDVNIHAHGHVKVDKDGAKAIGQGLNTIGSQVGLGATMAGVGAAVSKSIAKSSLPPLQKAGLVIGGAAMGGLIHSGISSLNRNAINAENNSSVSSNNNIGSNAANKLIDDSNISSLQELLFNEEMINYLCLGILYLVIIQLIFKLYFKDNINFKFLNNNSISNKLEFYFNKIVKLNKQMSLIWIWFGLGIIIIGINFDSYVLYNLYTNIDNFINVHLSFNPNIINSDVSFTKINNYTIKDIMLNLIIVDIVSLITVISLISFIILKFYSNKDINNVYIWLTILILIFTFSFTAYTYGDLHNNINDYVSLYINLKNK